MNPLHLEFALAALGLALLLVESFLTVSRRTLAYAGIAGLGVALLLLISGAACGELSASVATFYAVDRLAIFYKVLALLSTIIVLFISLEYAPVINQFVSSHPEKTKEAGWGEFFTLPIFVCVGLMFMASAKDLITIFVALELVTVSFYVLVAYMRRNALSLEAGVKYLILGALSTGLLVYGMAWLYGLTGELSLAGISQKVAQPGVPQSGLLFAAALVLAGLAFKVGLVPFHIWVPDVYQGAPTPVTAFLSVGSKAAGFIVLTRVYEALVAPGSVIAPQITHMLLILAGITILVGNFAALRQTNFKRLLAYSSIAHAGFLVLALASRHSVSGFTSAEIGAFYLATYLPMTFICFLILSAARAQGIGEDIQNFKGLGRRHPWMALALTLALASLAGLPLTAGFMGKLLVIFSAAYDSSYIALGAAVAGAATGFYYYFKIILVIYSEPEGEPLRIHLSAASKGVLAVLAASIIVVGVYPDSVRRVLVKDTTKGAPAQVSMK